ncbi:hypothetical protein [Streptomyces sp. NBC_00986]|uniref:hypothetical protein n=1 Tax=Streptomyces sp. NBC_00986 TaxID=2903702 RepID=UPI00386FE34B|nr:hypothetical protein OG504_34985 [Streptomyces sp. NBC_00986]
MGKKKRAAAAAAISSATGVAAGMTAAHFGLGPDESVRVGGSVATAVGNLLFQTFRLTSYDIADGGSSGTETAGIEDSSADSNSIVETTNISTEAAGAVVVSNDIINVETPSPDTADATAKTTPSAPAPQPPVAGDMQIRDVKHPRHRKRQRAARRRIERRERNERHVKEEGHGAS